MFVIMAEKNGKGEENHMDRKKNVTRKIRILTAITLLSATLFGGCGKAEEYVPKLEGSCEEILNQVYENAELDPELREVMEQGYYTTVAVDESTEEYLLGTTELSYTEAVCSMPMANATAYQCIVLRLGEDADILKSKQLLMDNADPMKWICVQAESVVVENVGDVILYVMADRQTADALKTAFLALGES